MKIAAASTIAATELALERLYASPIVEPLKLPTRIRHLAGGAEIALVQLIVTWAQRNSPRILETYLSGANEPVEDFVRRLPGLISTLCSDEVVGSPAPLPLTDVAKEVASERFEQLYGRRPGEAFRGGATEIVCFDHIGKGTPFLLYQPSSRSGPQFRSRENFRTLATWLLERSTPEDYLDSLDPMAAEAIGGMLFEVFKNTQDHALVDENGDVLDVSVRALKTNRFSMLPADLVRIVDDYQPLADYFRTLVARRGGVQTHFIELSVLDSGPGFAATWTKRPLNDLSDEDEERAVRSCFGRGSAKGDSRFGEGLPHVMRLLQKQKGFLRLRTGRTSFFADYSGLATAAEVGSLQRYAPNAHPLGRVAGSALTLIIPLDRLR